LTSKIYGWPGVTALLPDGDYSAILVLARKVSLYRQDLDLAQYGDEVQLAYEVFDPGYAGEMITEALPLHEMLSDSRRKRLEGQRVSRLRDLGYKARDTRFVSQGDLERLQGLVVIVELRNHKVKSAIRAENYMG
jgi:hypothetical protein